jgi:hypothetical protein
MNYKEIEWDIISNSYDRDKIENVKMSLLTRLTKLDYFIERFMEDFEFDIAVNDIKTRFYNNCCSEYGTIKRLLRVINHYAK